MQRSRRPPESARFLLSIAFLGSIFYLLKGRELNFSIWGGIAMAAAYVGIGLLLEFILRRRR